MSPEILGNKYYSNKTTIYTKIKINKSHKRYTTNNITIHYIPTKDDLINV
jgi:hypothetical protein